MESFKGIHFLTKLKLASYSELNGNPVNVLSKFTTHLYIRRIKRTYNNHKSFTCLDFLSRSYSVVYLSFPLSLIISHDKLKPPRTRVAPCTLTDIHQSINLSCQLGSLPFFEECAMEKRFCWSVLGMNTVHRESVSKTVLSKQTTADIVLNASSEPLDAHITGTGDTITSLPFGKHAMEFGQGV